jgi:hypothetical protein
MRLKLFIIALTFSFLPCFADPPLLPDPALTPGEIFSNVTAAQVSRPGYARSVRNVTAKEKRAVYAEYGIKHHKRGEYEIDHLISLELGGSNDIRNLWPQSYLTPVWNAHTKDRLEDRLHSLVAKGKISLALAQHDIATNWISAYGEYFGAAPNRGAK